MSVRAVSVLPDVLTGGSENRDEQLETEIVALFEQLRDRLLRYLLSFGLAIPDGEEVIQEAFLSLFRHLQCGKPRHNLRAWLFRVAHNLALKRRYRMRRDSDVLTALIGESAMDNSPNPEDQMLSSQIHRHVRTVLQALPELDRRCICLRAEGLRYREIAEILDMSLGAVSLSLARSLARIERATGR